MQITNTKVLDLIDEYNTCSKIHDFLYKKKQREYLFNALGINPRDMNLFHQRKIDISKELNKFVYDNFNGMRVRVNDEFNGTIKHDLKKKDYSKALITEVDNVAKFLRINGEEVLSVLVIADNTRLTGVYPITQIVMF